MASNPKLVDLMLEHLELARTLRKLTIYFDPQKCTGVWECIQVCPVGCWEKDMGERKAVFVEPDSCIACNACVIQCPEEAIELRV
jgi:NAD-dependent dihydropyrimidine dehydrogenase PreA subunit